MNNLLFLVFFGISVFASEPHLACPNGSQPLKDDSGGETSFWCEKTGKSGFREGPAQKFYSNKKPKVSIEYKDNLEDGPYTLWSENGIVLKRGEFKKGQKTGKWKEFYPNGTPRHEGAYEEDQRVCSWTYWDEKDVSKVVFEKQNTSNSCPTIDSSPVQTSEVMIFPKKRHFTLFPSFGYSNKLYQETGYNDLDLNFITLNLLLERAYEKWKFNFELNGDLILIQNTKTTSLHFFSLNLNGGYEFGILEDFFKITPLIGAYFSSTLGDSDDPGVLNENGPRLGIQIQSIIFETKVVTLNYFFEPILNGLSLMELSNSTHLISLTCDIPIVSGDLVRLGAGFQQSQLKMNSVSSNTQEFFGRLGFKLSF